MRIIIVLITILITVNSACAQDQDPFGVTTNDNQWDISSLTCEQFATLLHEKSPQLFPITVWLHGLASGLDRKIEPFHNNNGSLLVLAASLCGKDRNKKRTIFNEFLKLKDRK